MAQQQQADEQEQGPVSTFDPNTPQQGEEADEETLARIRERDEANIAAAQEESDPGKVAARVGGRVGAIAITAEKNSLAAKYAADAPWGALFTADPGTTGSVTGEVTGGSYARVTISWGTASGGVITGSATFNVPAVTVTFAGVCALGTAGVADLKDRIAITSQTFGTPGTLTVNYSYTQT